MSSNTRTYTSDAYTELIMIAVPKGLRSRFIRDAIKCMDLKRWLDELIGEKAK